MEKAIKSGWVAPLDPSDDVHVDGWDDTPETIVWLIDGQEVGREPNKHWHLQMNLTAGVAKDD